MRRAAGRAQPLRSPSQPACSSTRQSRGSRVALLALLAVQLGSCCRGGAAAEEPHVLFGERRSAALPAACP